MKIALSFLIIILIIMIIITSISEKRSNEAEFHKRNLNYMRKKGAVSAVVYDTEYSVQKKYTASSFKKFRSFIRRLIFRNSGQQSAELMDILIFILLFAAPVGSFAFLAMNSVHKYFYDNDIRAFGDKLSTLLDLVTINVLNVDTDSSLFQLFLTQVSLTFITITILSIFSDSNEYVYWENKVKKRLIEPKFTSFKAFSLYSFGFLFISFLAIGLLSTDVETMSVEVLFSFISNIVSLVSLTMIMLSCYYKDSRASVRKRFQQILKAYDCEYFNGGQQQFSREYREEIQKNFQVLFQQTQTAFEGSDYATLFENISVYGNLFAYAEKGHLQGIDAPLNIDVWYNASTFPAYCKLVENYLNEKCRFASDVLRFGNELDFSFRKFDNYVFKLVRTLSDSAAESNHPEDRVKVERLITSKLLTEILFYLAPDRNDYTELYRYSRPSSFFGFDNRLCYAAIINKGINTILKYSELGDAKLENPSVNATVKELYSNERIINKTEEISAFSENDKMNILKYSYYTEFEKALFEYAYLIVLLYKNAPIHFTYENTEIGGITVNGNYRFIPWNTFSDVMIKTSEFSEITENKNSYTENEALISEDIRINKILKIRISDKQNETTALFTENEREKITALVSEAVNESENLINK